MGSKLSKKDKVYGSLVLLTIVSAISIVAFTSVYTVLLFATFLSLLGVAVIYFSLISIKVSWASRSWIPVDYKISHSTVKQENRMNRENRFNQYTPFYELEYFFNNKTYHVSSGQNLNLHKKQVFYTLAKAVDFLVEVKSKSLGEKLYVNPDNPNVAFLRVGLNRSQSGTVFFGVLLIVISILSLCTYLVLPQ